MKQVDPGNCIAGGEQRPAEHAACMTPEVVALEDGQQLALLEQLLEGQLLEEQLEVQLELQLEVQLWEQAGQSADCDASQVWQLLQQLAAF